MKSQKAFVVFLLNDGYQPVETKQGVSYVRDGSPTLQLNFDGSFNQSLKKRWNLFLKLWLKNGKDWIEALAKQYRFNFDIKLVGVK
ncbi:hypothetical protein RFH42_10540 [Acinetobacter rudis]|uniref:hypothetical protein n=1 Tax=Acinetobacter rudis TaxID=632955 RepID=UPI0028104EB3|nr:hypothetical protein [Acinetobacter rudis]MDQ8953396.1 hypothetical protein [Acinetobacter rudis]